MRKIFTLLFTFYVLVVASEAQNNSITKIQNNATKFFNDDDYENAILSYKSLIDIDSNQAEYNYQLGLCYTKIGKQIESLLYFEKAEKLNHPNIKLYYYLGTTNHLNHNFEKAIYYFELLKQKFNEQNIIDPNILKEVDNYIAQCNVGKNIIQKPLNVKIENLGKNLNSIYPEYIPLISSDEQTLIFTTRRPKNDASKKDLVDNHYFEDVYISKKENGIWQMASPIKGFINTVHHDACVSLNYDGNKLYLYKEQDGDIYYSNFKNNAIGWAIPEALNENINTKNWEPSAYESTEDSTMYFSSNRPGGFGGLDLYKSKMINGDWGPAENLGSTINTQEDEDAPFVHKENNSLYFSSKGHYNMGGYDIFISKYDAKVNKWTKPQNIGYPLNSAGDDIFFSWNKNLSNVYFSSIRADSYGEKDIYMATSLEKEKPIVVLSDTNTLLSSNQTISGKVFNSIHPLNSTTKTYVYLTYPKDITIEENLDSTNRYLYQELPFSEHNIIFESPLLKINASTPTQNETNHRQKKPEKNKSVYLLNAKNEIVAQTKSDNNGDFTFKDLSPLEDFKLIFSSDDSLAKKNKRYNTSQSTVVSAIENGFKNTYIIYGKIENALNKTVSISNKEFNASSQPNKEGYFAFIRLSDKEYSVETIENGLKYSTNSYKILSDSCLFTSALVPKFKYKKLPIDVNESKHNYELSGKVKVKSGVDLINDISLLLINSKGEVISQTKTDLNGHFNFSKIHPDAYYILFEKNNVNLKAEVLNITDNFYNASLKTPIFKLIEEHVFKVQADSIKKYTDIVNSEFVLGQSLYKKTNLVAPNTHVNLYSDNNELFSQTTSNRFGYFAFKDLPVANYKINFPLNSSAIKAKLNYTPADYEIIIHDTLAKGNKKLIVYGKLLDGKENNFLKQTIFLIDKNGKVLNTSTDKNGYFAFVKIENTNYSLIIKPNTIPKLQLQPMLDLTDRCLFIPKATVQNFKYYKIEKNTSDKTINFVLQGKIKTNIQSQPINDISMLLIDDDGNVVDKTNTNNTGHFTFHKLQLGNYYVVFETQNSNLKAEIVYANDNSSIPNDVATKYFLNEKVYFDYKSVSLDDSAKINLTLVLKKLIESPLQKINIYTYADPFGSNTYNLKLTAQRAQTIKNYFIRYGISKNNIKIIPRGEFKPLFISADKHANRLNRRAEFEIIQY